MTVTIQTVGYCNFGDGSTTGYYAVPLWTLNTAYTVGQIVRQKTTPAVGSERCFICTIAGTSSNTTEPTWVLTRGAKLAADNGVVQWFEATGLPGLNGDLTNTPLSSQNRSGIMPIGAMITNNTQDHYYWCTTAGTTGAGEPTYPTTLGSGTSDGTATWTCIGPVGSFTTAFAAPQARLANIGATWVPTGGTVYVSAIHAETQATSLAITPTSAIATPAKIICISNTPSLPPVGANVTTGASVTTTGTVATITLNPVAVYWVGIAFNCGTLTSAQSVAIGGTPGTFASFRNCSFNLLGSGVQQLQIGNGARDLVVFDNTTVQLGGNTSAFINVGGGHFHWKDTASALSKATGSWPTTLFIGSAFSGDFLVENVDLNAFAGTQMFGSSTSCGRWVFTNCKLPTVAAATISAFTGQFDKRVDFINCDSAGLTYNHSRFWYEGQQTVDTSATPVGGASDGTTAFSWKVVTSAASQWFAPFECLPIKVWNTTINPNNVTVTIEGAFSGTALPNNDEIWLEVAYFGTASSTLGSRATETKASILSSASALGASTADWGTNAPARQNSHAYVLGDLIGVLSAPTGTIMRMFVCTGAGTSNGSLPAGYASAVDGGVVTDSGATFRAVERFQLTVLLSTPQPQSAGYLTCYVKAARASATYWVSPLATLS